MTVRFEDLISIERFKEFDKKYELSIKDCISQIASKEKPTLLHHMKKAECIAAMCSGTVDVITGENVPRERLIFSDGVYKWRTDIVYYLEKYNLKLPQEFIDYVLSVEKN